jgi:hypothetical protein
MSKMRAADQLLADYDQNQRPQARQPVETVGRDHVQVDEHCEDADQDQGYRP